jgi:1,2-dihydroxy-3-keto-5-methylthiopentene dioxygenase
VTRLAVYAPEEPARLLQATTDAGRIAEVLGGIGVGFERWPTRDLADGVTDAAILDAYGADIRRLSEVGGYRSADIARIRRGTPDIAPIRAKFLDEHIHDEDEVRFFVEGQGAFYLHVAGQVHQVVCGRGDLLSVPAGTRHWFDMGPDPAFTAIRLFTNPEGWVARFTGDTIAKRLPAFDA